MARSLAALALILAPLATGCAAPGASAAVATKPVQFRVALPATEFAPGDVQVSVWSAAELDREARSAGCVVGWDGAHETVSCPPGVRYERAAPEQFTFTTAQLAAGVVVAATSVHPGERYQLSIGGRAADGCNHAVAEARGVADGGEVTLAGLSVMTTEMACVRPPHER